MHAGAFFLNVIRWTKVAHTYAKKTNTVIMHEYTNACAYDKTTYLNVTQWSRARPQSKLTTHSLTAVFVDAPLTHVWPVLPELYKLIILEFEGVR